MLKPILRGLYKKEFSKISTRVTHAKSHLESSQIKLDKDSLKFGLQEEERIAYARYVDLCKVDESLAHQKSRIQWLGLGDRNSKFFFKAIKGNINKGRISSVVLCNGNRVNKSEDVYNTFVDSFTNLFGKPFSDCYNGYERINDLVSQRVTSNQFNDLARDVTDKDIHDVFWSLKANKAPGPDDYSSGLFKKSWVVVGQEL